MNSFLMRKRSNDSDLRLNEKLGVRREKILMLVPIFTVCTLGEASKGETNGTGFANKKRFFLDENTKSIREARKYEAIPRNHWTEGGLSYRECRIAWAKRVDGYGSLLYSRGKGARKLVAGSSSRSTVKIVTILIEERG